MRRVISWIILVIAGAIVVLMFITSTSYIQLGIAILLYFVIAYIALKLLPRKITAIPVVIVQNKTEVNNIEDIKDTEVADIDKRSFLKLIGASGVTFFLSWLFTNKARNPFFGNTPAPETVSIKDTSGKEINPSEKQLTDGYKITEIDDSIIAYYGFTHQNNTWFIMRLDTDTGSFRYARGSTNFESNWTIRENLKYDYYVNVFK